MKRRNRKQKRSKTEGSRYRAKGPWKKKKERAREGRGSSLDPYIFQLVAYKRIAIVIKVHSLLSCEVIATISFDAFSAPVINVRGSNEGRCRTERRRVRLKSAAKVSRNKSKVYRDSIKDATGRLQPYDLT